MAEIVDIDDFKKRKLAKAEADWDQYMSRAEQFQQEGKKKFADEMLAKAKVARTVIDKLRGPVPKREHTPFLKYGNHDKMMMTYNFDGLGLAGVDFGYPKPPEKG